MFQSTNPLIEFLPMVWLNLGTFSEDFSYCGVQYYRLGE